MEPPVRRFACTRCGKCCDRSPEVELSEAAGLADIFVFSLMFRLYWLPDRLSDYAAGTSAGGSAAYYEKKRLLGAFAVRKSPAKVSQGGKPVRYTKYLSLSALALDTSPGACAALEGTSCGIHDRRPLGCRSVPVHYSRTEAASEAGFDAFVATPGFGCDTGDAAPVLLEDGRVVAPHIRAARAEAQATASRDRNWSEAIVRRMGGGSSPLPSQQQVEANAAFGATIVPMRVAWEIAADEGLIGRGECSSLVAQQLATIERELARGRCGAEARETLLEMRTAYRDQLGIGCFSAPAAFAQMPVVSTAEAERKLP